MNTNKDRNQNISTLIAVLFILFVLSGCKDSGDAYIERPNVTGVTLLDVESQEIVSYYTTSGTIKANIVSEVSSRVMGTVTSIEVTEGDRVSQGQLLLTIDNRDIQNQVKAAENRNKVLSKALEASGENKKLLNITYERYNNLYNEKAISGQEMDEVATKKRLADIQYEQAQAALEAGRANLEELRINLDYTKIKSSVNGIITGKYVEIGNTAVPGKPLLKVEDNSSFRLEAMVDEKFQDELQEGIPVNVRIDSLDKDIAASISEVVPAVDPDSRTLLIKIDIKNGEDLKSGLYAKASIPSGRRQVIMVPEKAVVEKGQLEGVYIVNAEGIVNYRLVRLGAKSGQQIEVLSGLKSGDRIIIEGLDNTVDGGVVKDN